MRAISARVLAAALSIGTTMRKEYSRILKVLIEQGLQHSAFGWQAQKIKSRFIAAGERVFSKPGKGQLLFWTALVLHERFETFTFEVGWSQHGRFPELSMRPSLKAPSDAHTLPEYMVRLGRLIDGADRWWEVEAFTGTSNLQDLTKSIEPISPEVARARVEPVAESALKALELHAVPFLEALFKTQL